MVACRKDRPVASASVLDLALEVPMLARLLRADFVAVVAAKTGLPLGCMQLLLALRFGLLSAVAKRSQALS